MANTEAENNGGEAVVEKARTDIKTEIEAAKTEAQKKALVEKLKRELKDAEAPAKEVVNDIKSKGKNEHRDEGRQALRTLIRVAEAAKNGIVIDEIKTKPKTQKVLIELAEKSLTAETAASIETHLKDYLLGDKDILFSSVGQEKTQFEKDFESLSQTKSNAAVIVRDAVAKQASEFGKTESEIKVKLEVKEETQDQIQKPPDSEQIEKAKKEYEEATKRAQENYADNQFRHDMQMTYGARFQTAEELTFLEAIYDGNKFVSYVKKRLDPTDQEDITKVQKIKDHLRHEIEENNKLTGKTMNEDQIKREVEKLYRDEASENIMRTLTNMINKVYIQLTRERPSTPSQEIERENIYRGIGATITALKGTIEGLADKLAELENSPNNSYIKSLRLSAKIELKPISEDVEFEKDGTKVKKIRHRLQQIPVSKEVSLSEFAKLLELEMNHLQHAQRYLHDGSTIYSHPAHDPEKGFYGGLSGFAEHLQGGDLDSILILPDGALIIEAFQLYDKYLDEQMAFQDWKHEPSQFTTKAGDFTTHAEDEVLRALSLKHPEYDYERLRGALHMGKGLARTTFLNEPEKAAYADPVLHPDGSMTGTSYYTNDVSPLMVFNPIHLYMRWQGEPNLFPFLFFPTDANSLNKKGMWNHEEVWNNLGQFKDSYFKGRGALGDKKLFIDNLMNLGGVGGVAQRKGWRQYFGNEANFIFKEKTVIVDGKETKVQTHTIDALKTWQTLEKIGFEVMNDFVVNNRIPFEVLRAKGEYAKDRNELFDYLFKTYFHNEGDLTAYLEDIRRTNREGVIKKIRNGEIAPGSIEEAIEEKVSKVFLYRTLSRMIADRIPTKFLRIDRDRFSEKGISRWKEIKERLGWEPKRYDEAMKNLGLVESMLRSDISSKIKERLKLMNAHDLKDIKLDDMIYRLDEQVIESFLKAAQRKANEKGSPGMKDEEINDVKALFNEIHNKFSGNKEFLNKFAHNIENKDYPFSFALDEFDISLLAFRGAGPRVIPRSIADIALMEKNVMNGCILELPNVLHQTAISGKKDFSEIIKILYGVKQAYGQVHGAEAGYETIHKIAGAVITYFKKDTMSKGILGLTRIGKPNSIAAKIAGGRSTAVWEWDAVDIDNFIVALETNRLLPRDYFDPSQPLKYEAIWVNAPFSANPIRLPENFKLPFKLFGKDEIPLFRRRVRNYRELWSNKLRKDFGGKWYDVSFDFAVKYGPLFMAFMLWKFFKDALDEAQGTKKK